MPTDGDSVSVHYQGSLDNGKIFDSTHDREPLEFVVGSDQVLPAFGNAIRDLAVGDKITVRIESDDAYGDRDEGLVFNLPAEGAPPGLREGDQLLLDGDRPAIITEVSDSIVKADANHLLAGQALTFEIELVSIN